MASAPILVRVWEYGWLCRDVIPLPAATSAQALIVCYLGSASFHTSFLPNDKDETGIHGPFVASRIRAEDFVPLAESDMAPYLRTIEFSEEPGRDELERGKLAPFLVGAFQGNKHWFVLRRDERDRALFHEWGSVLFHFREFLFFDVRFDSLERYARGCD